MNVRRAIVWTGGALFAACLAMVWIGSGGRYSDGPEALAGVARLGKGMTVYQAIYALHPKRAREVPSIGYSMRPSGAGSELIHGLTPDRHIVIRVAKRPRRTKISSGATIAYDEPILARWEVREGPAPREDVKFGRVFAIAGMRLNY